MSFSESDPHVSPVVQEIRTALMQGLASVPEFALATGRCERTIWSYIAQGMPVEYVGRTPFPVITPAIAWLRKRRAPRRQEPRGRGRPKANAA
jgi:hypothetical protein